MKTFWLRSISFSKGNMVDSRQYLYSKGAVEIARVSATTYNEFFFNVRPQPQDTPEKMLSRLQEAVKTVDAGLMSVEIFGGLGSGAQSDALLADIFGDRCFPVTWVEEMSGSADRLAGIQAWGMAGVAIQPIQVDGNCLGTYVDLPEARYCRLGGIVPADTQNMSAAQAGEVFARMSVALDQCCMSFRNVIRTWFFNHHLLNWYDDFNGVRDAFFRSCEICERFVPASTGIEGGNPRGAALVAGALAFVPKMNQVSAQPVVSPLQCPALDYGSSFSRAVEMQLPGLRRLYLSGTASISPEGDTQFEGNAPAQMVRTMEVVAAILRSRDMDWHNINRAITYFKDREDFDAFVAWREKEVPNEFPVIMVHNDVCRDNLLFEIELDAMLLRS